MKKQMKFACLVALVTTVSTASAHEGMHGPGAAFDTDEDGVLSLVEYTAYLKSTQQSTADAGVRFAQLDTDKSKSLSSVEFLRGLPKKPATAN